MMHEAATKEAAAATASGREWTRDEVARDQRPVEDVIAAGVLLDVSRLLAARLSQIGWLTVSAETHEAALRGDALLDEEWRAVASHPQVARDLLAEVTRLDGVREMIARQREPFAVPGEAPVPLAKRDRLMLGGQILHLCAD